MEEIKPVDIKNNNSRVESQFKEMLKSYNPIFASIVFDKNGYGYILDVKLKPNKEEKSYIDYEADLFCSTTEGKIETDSNKVAEASFTYHFNYDEFFINNIKVKEDWQNNGIGTAILKSIEKFARAKNCDKIRLLCLKRVKIDNETGKLFNANYYFYRKEGYKESFPVKNFNSLFIEMKKNITNNEVNEK